MTADHQPHRLPLRLIIAALAVLPLLAAGCGSSGAPADSSSHSPGSSTHSDEGGSQSSDSARETAEHRLEDIGPQLATVLADYRSGKKQQAYTLAKSVSAHLYEGPPRGSSPRSTRPGNGRLTRCSPRPFRPPSTTGNPPARSQLWSIKPRGWPRACLAAIHKSEGSS